MQKVLKPLLMLFGLVFSGFPEADVYRCDVAGKIIYQGKICKQGYRLDIEELTEIVPAKGIRQSERTWLQQREKTRLKNLRKPKAGSTTKSLLAEKRQAQICWKKQQQLDSVRAKLRRGYKPSQGDNLRQKRKSYESYLFEFC